MKTALMSPGVSLYLVFKSDEPALDLYFLVSQLCSRTFHLRWSEVKTAYKSLPHTSESVEMKFLSRVNHG